MHTPTRDDLIALIGNTIITDKTQHHAKEDDSMITLQAVLAFKLQTQINNLFNPDPDINAQEVQEYVYRILGGE